MDNQFRSALVFLLVMLTCTSKIWAVPKTHYQVHNLVSNGVIKADFRDPLLINPIGLASGLYQTTWIANNGSGAVTNYDGFGNKYTQPITIPAVNINQIGTPTGIVFNTTLGFVVSELGHFAPSSFIFATEDGTISAYAFTVNRSKAIITINNSPKKACYTGLTLGADGRMSVLYAADFHNGKIDMFNDRFKPINDATAFIDPNLPQGYAPFNVKNIQGDIYVSYAVKDAKSNSPVKGEGLGIVNVFDAKGHFLKRVATGNKLNAPWAMAMTPANFGIYSNVLLIGNVGNGKINVFTSSIHLFLGQLRDANHNVISINGLWGLAFGNGYWTQPTDTLYFTAGSVNEKYGVYGSIKPV